jgi:hypothetical protein
MMGESTVSIALTEGERKIIAALRELPQGQAQELLQEVLDQLVSFVRDPHCAEMQADGVPCAAPSSDCEQCARLKEILAGLRRAFALP